MEEQLQQQPATATERGKEGKRLLKLRRYGDALIAFEQATQLDPQAAFAYTGRGAALIGLRCYEEALLACEQAIQLNPMYGAAYIYKARVLHCLKRYGEARDALEQALQLNPTDKSLQNNLQRYRRRLRLYRIDRAYGELWRLYYAIIILASGGTMTWLAFRLNPLFAPGLALLTIAAVLIMLFKTFR
jgi:tetratricopeptide (TPR) repeat protein